MRTSLPLGLARGRKWLLALVVSLLAALAAQVPAAVAAPPSYVSLGDSYTAGPLIPVQIPPFGCLKSDHNYPHLAAPSFGLPLRDPSCSGAETEDMTQTQNVNPGPNPPQFNSLDSNTRIVTIGIGGNDIGFSEIARNCSSTQPHGTPCQDRYVVNGVDEISERIKATAPKVATVLQGIHTRSRKARVYVVNYLPIFPETGPGCWPQVPVTAEDTPYLRDKQKELNAMLATQAAANGAGLVDAYTAGRGRDACQLPVLRWVEPAVPVNAAAPLHPNLEGMIGTKDAVLATVR
jgi:lysophospholipase L1-like esterase